jgi:tRNA (adenine22-N1)-methyltransferase
MANAREAGFFEKIKFVLTDGAAALADEGLTDVAICGMGGELIAEIIDKSPFFKDAGIRLILQPMSRQGQLRSYRAKNGF